MNSVSLIGRITHDPEIKNAPSGTPYLLFSIAVDRGYKDQNGNKQTDFIPCVAWNNQADFISRYVKKGNLIEITGTTQSRVYQNQQGENRTVIEVIVNQVGNLTPKPKEVVPAPQEPSYFNPSYSKDSIVEDDDLPF